MTAWRTLLFESPRWRRCALGMLAVCLAALPVSHASAQEMASDAGIAQRQLTLEQRLDKIEELLELSLRPWEPVAPNIWAFDKWMREEGGRLLNYEFGVMRNGGFRIMHVSTWNGGYRFMTEPYWRGDDPSKSKFGLGGSVWLLGTKDPADANCGKPGYVLHRYYEYLTDGVRVSSGNGCTSEGPVYARKRVLVPDLP